MSRDKQIEEMADIINNIEYNAYSEMGEEFANADRIAEDLVNAGYRKSAEVAREIFEELQGLLIMRIGVTQAIAELKKKYTEQ